jgi:hypothetical protein
MQKFSIMTSNHDFTDFSAIRDRCEKTGRITERVIDGFLISFAASRYDLEKKMELQFKRYRHVLDKFAKSEVNLFKSQYIAHKIFKNGGLLEKLLKLPALNRLSDEEREYLVLQTEISWRFSFAEISGEPAKDFFRMRDVFTGEDYLLFSQGTSRINEQGTKLLWLNLIGFNGACWQSYGPIGAFQSFDSDDVFFFATEKDPGVEVEEEVQEDIEADPLPYMLLISGSAYPRTFSKEFETIIMMAEHESEIPDSARMKKKFIVEYNKEVYRYTHKKLGEHPHFAQVFYDEKEGILLFQALTEYGFIHLVRDFNSLGYDIPEIAYLCVRLQMVTTAESILKRKIVLNEYDDLFRKDPDPSKAGLNKNVNEFLGLITTAINEGREPDIEEAARLTGVDPESAAGIVKAIRKQMEKYDRPDLSKEKNESSTGKVENQQKPDHSADPYSRIYSAAKQIGDLEPWINLYETDNFGVRMPKSGVTWFISVMGNSGEYTAIAAYRGYEGFSGFNRLHGNPDSYHALDLMTIPHLLISFTDREELSKEDLAAIKKSGVTFRGKGKWLKLEEVVPGLVPDFPGEKTLEDLPDLLEQTLSVLEETKSDPGLLLQNKDRNDKILIRIPSEVAGQLQWNNSFEDPDKGYSQVVYKPVWNQKSADTVALLKTRPVTIQCDLSLMPAPVRLEGKKAYFPFLLLLVDKKSGMIFGTTLLQPLPDIPAMYESFPQKLLQEILKLKYRPGSLEIRSRRLFDLSEAALKQAGCTLVLTDHMPAMDEALESLINNIGK